MPSSTSSDGIEWFRYPLVATHDLARTWLTTETLLGLAPNTLDAYARGLDDFLGFSQRADISPVTATRADLARYVGDLRGRPRLASNLRSPGLTPSTGLSNAALQQRLTAVRLFFDFLIEEGKRTDHPVGRGVLSELRARKYIIFIECLDVFVSCYEAVCINAIKTASRWRNTRCCSESEISAPIEWWRRKELRTSSHAQQKRAADANVPKPRMG